jgi:hypothetical protein
LTYLTNGWSVKPLIQIQNGLPYSATYSGTTPQSCYGAGCLVPATGIEGTAATTNFIPFLGRNTFTLPRTVVVDARVEKDFRFAEKYDLQLIGEAFNLANHVNITGSGSTSAFALGTTNKNALGTPAAQNITFAPSFLTTTTVAGGATANSNFAYSPRLIQLAARIVF